MTDQPLADRLTAIFLEEMDEQLRRMGADVLAMESAPTDPQLLKSVLRGAHTLKGAARAAGVPEIERTCHALEALLTRARAGNLTLSESDFGLLFSALDALEDSGRRIRAGESLADAPIAELARSLDRPVTGARAAAPRASRAVEQPPSPEVERAAAPRLNVDPEKVDALLASAGELLVATRQMPDRPGRVAELHERTTRSAAALRRLMKRARPALEEIGAEQAAEELMTRLGELADLARDAAGTAAREARLLGRLASDLGERMRALRMRPFSEACEPLARVVRDVASAGGKKVRLEVVGGEVAADRAVLDAVREALLHLARNAVDHGIEEPALRRERGKAEVGVVTIEAGLQGDRLLVTVADDGAGLDADAIRARLAESGRTVPEGDAELGAALMEGGLSTRSRATAISGRGVGLDVVRSVAERVRGRVDIRWTAGEGTRFVLECPVSLGALRSVLVRAGDQTLAVPTADIERLGRVDVGRLRRVEGRVVVPGDAGPIPVASLAALLGPPLPPLAAEAEVPVLHMRVGERRLVVAVDELLAEEELIVRPIQPSHARPPLASGVALLGDGGLALVLDGAALIGTGLSAPAARTGFGPEAGPGEPDAKQTVLVVDDSITTRTLEESILTSAGYDVVTAGDGAEAWRLLRRSRFDLVVSDVEMPGLDGFELCAKIRASADHADLPVILVTALESAEHRARGLEVGADAYVPKSSFDQRDLLDTIHRLIG